MEQQSLFGAGEGLERPPTLTRMGRPVPVGWEQPRPWPVRTEEALRAAVHHAHGGRCQRCGEPTAQCLRLDGAVPVGPTTLLPICRPCTGGRRFWSAEEEAAYRQAAARTAPTVERMTGWGLAPDPLPRSQPKRSPHGPLKREGEYQVVRLGIRITARERDRALSLSGEANLNALLRDLFTDYLRGGRARLHREDRVRLNRAALQVQQVAGLLEAVLAGEPVGSREQVREWAAELDRVRTALVALAAGLA